MKTKIRTVIEVDYYELDQAINKFYGKVNRGRGAFSVVADQELSNDSEKEVTVEKRKPDKTDQEQIDDFKERGSFGFSLQALLKDMCWAGEIEPGNYLIKVCW